MGRHSKDTLKVFALLAIANSVMAVDIAKIEENRGKPNDVGGSVFLNSGFSDNGAKEPEQEIDERQDIFGLNLRGNYSNKWFLATSDYTVEEKRFSESTQEHRNTIDGSTDVLIGNKKDVFSLRLEHSRKKVLKSSDLLEVLDNIDERDILSVEPAINWSFTGTDTLHLSGSFVSVQFKESPESDLDISGFNLEWAHQSSAVTTWGLKGTSMELEFDENPSNDYDYGLASAYYQVRLRNLSYYVELGVNRATPANGEDYDHPFYNILAAYEKGSSRLEFSAMSRITDSSQGNGNGGLIDDLGLTDADRNANGQLELSRAEIEWETTLLCERCVMKFSGGYESEIHELEKKFDKDELFLSATFQYKINRALTASLSAQSRDITFDELSNSDDHTLQRLRLSFTYQYSPSVDLGLYVETEERKSDDLLKEYEEGVAGVRLRYRF